MTPTPEMIEAAAKTLCERSLRVRWETVDPYMQRAYRETVAPILKAALAAMWRPISEFNPKVGAGDIFRYPDPEYDGEISIAQGWYEESLAERCFYVVGDRRVGPTHFIPLSVFEDRK